MAPNLPVVGPNNIFRKVPTRRPNVEMRSREYLTPHEVEKLMAAAKLGRHGHRDATLVLVAFRHGLRAVEIADLEWSQVEWGRNPALHVRRAKNGKPQQLSGSLPNVRHNAPRFRGHQQHRGLLFVYAEYLLAASITGTSECAIQYCTRSCELF
jgi:integrase